MQQPMQAGREATILATGSPTVAASGPKAIQSLIGQFATHELDAAIMNELAVRGESSATMSTKAHAVSARTRIYSGVQSELHIVSKDQ
jgi:hypothetical protein